ncbi:hypothetical protein [Dactylosporangium matsuzakiense]|nr:hypothetical protein [Dactylosporangium matsuzakiense]UWZ48289.1 hypothetical protein Dmats_18905 [Dactylosporangium matsuzakiense]
MSSDRIEILDATTAARLGHCSGPTTAGECPAADEGPVPCAGRLVRPPGADPQAWPMWVPPDSHHCPLGSAHRAAECLRQADFYQDAWLAGLRRQTELVHHLAAAGDKRFKDEPPDELARISRLRWLGSPYAQELARMEQTFRQRAQGYLAFARRYPYRYPAERSHPTGASDR